MILIKARGNVCRKNFRKLKNASEFEGKRLRVSLARKVLSQDDRLSFVFLYKQCRVYDVKSAVVVALYTHTYIYVCGCVYTQLQLHGAQNSILVSQEEGGRPQKMPDIEDVKTKRCESLHHN